MNIINPDRDVPSNHGTLQEYYKSLAKDHVLELVLKGQKLNREEIIELFEEILDKLYEAVQK